MSDDAKDIDLDRVDKALDSLGEHFDGVAIFAIRREGDKTFWIHRGTGCIFQRRDVIRTWLRREAECDKEQVRQQSDDPDNED